MHAVPFINKQIGLIKKVGLFMFTCHEVLNMYMPITLKIKRYKTNCKDVSKKKNI